MAAARAWITGFSYTQLVTSRYIVVAYRLKNRVLLGKAFERLERYAVKAARTVLRGGSGSNATSLPDQVTLARVLNGPAFWLRFIIWSTAPAHLMVALGRAVLQVQENVLINKALYVFQGGDKSNSNKDGSNDLPRCRTL